MVEIITALLRRLVFTRVLEGEGELTADSAVYLHTLSLFYRFTDGIVLIR